VAEPRTSGASGTRDQIVDAALETLKSEGYAGSSARAIARRGGFNQALIFYHFGTVNRLLVAALERTSDLRMARYLSAVEEASSLEDMLDVALRVYREDLEAGHMTVLSELIGASMSHPELKPEIVARMQPWIEFADGAIRKALEGSSIGSGLPTRQLAFGLVAFYLGLNMLNTLDGERGETEALFQTARSLAPVMAAILQVPSASGS